MQPVLCLVLLNLHVFWDASTTLLYPCNNLPGILVVSKPPEDSELLLGISGWSPLVHSVQTYLVSLTGSFPVLEEAHDGKCDGKGGANVYDCRGSMYVVVISECFCLAGRSTYEGMVNAHATSNILRRNVRQLSSCLTVIVMRMRPFQLILT